MAFVLACLHTTMVLMLADWYKVSQKMLKEVPAPSGVTSGFVCHTGWHYSH